MPTLKNNSPVSFILPAEPLRRYLSSYYFVDIGEGQATQDDLLYPEWASARFTLRGTASGNMVGTAMNPIPAASLTGPTGKAAMVRFQNIRLVGIGFLPLGWYRLIGCPANRWANKVGSVHEHPEFALLAKLHREIQRLTDTEQMAALFDHMLLPSVIDPDPLEAEIERIHHNIANPDIGSVSELAAITGISLQRVERLARRVFGFPPKHLLRRQRFLRTLAKVMEHPDLKWSAALDYQYFDQAHFNREFQQFMGMTPRQYLAMPRSTSIVTTQTRGRDLGHLLQALQGPGPLSGQ